MCGCGGWVGWLVEGDAETNFDLPAGNANVFHDEAHEALAIGEVEIVDAGADAGGEVAHPGSKSIVGGELGSLADQLGALCSKPVLAGFEFFCPAGELGEFDETGLVAVHEPASLAANGVELAVETGELAGQQVVVGSGFTAGQCGLTGGEQLGSQHSGPDLVEDEGVELVGPDPLLGAAPFGATCFERIVVRAVVVAVLGLGRAGRADLHAGAVNPARTADDQPAEQPVVGGGPAGTESRVVGCDALSGLEGLGGNDGGDRHGNPVFLGSQAGARSAAGAGSRDGLMLIPVGGAGVGRVAQQRSQGRAGPHRPAGRAGDAVGVEAFGDLAHGLATGHVVVEDTPDHGRFRLVDLKARWASLAAGDAPITVRDFPEDGLTGTDPEQLAPPFPFRAF